MKSVLLLMCLSLVLGTAAVVPLPVYAAEKDEPPPPAPPAKVEGEKAPEAKGAQGGGEGGGEKSKKPEDVSGGRFAGDPIFVHVAPMILPVISDSGVEQIITLQVDVQVKDFDAADSLHTNMPKVRDALMRSLYGGLGQGSLRNGKLVDVTRVKAKARKAVESVIGTENVVDVLIQGVAQRML